MNITEFRQQYPQYDKVNDKDLTDALYNKSYSGKIDRKEFDKQFLTKSASEEKPFTKTVPKWGQENPNLYGVAGAARETLGPIVEGLGFVGGGISGAAATPEAFGVGAIPGSALGLSAVREGLESADVALGNKPSSTTSQALSRIGSNMQQGAIWEAGGQMLPKALTINPESLTNPEIIRRMQLGAESGVPFTRAMINQSKPTAMLETQLSENPGSAGIAQKRYQAIESKTDDYARQKLDNMGGPMDAESAGELAQSQAKGKYGAFMKKAGEKYEAIPAQDQPLMTNSLKDVAEAHLDVLGPMQSSAVKRIVGLAQKSIKPEAEESGALVDEFGHQTTKSTPESPTYTVKQLLDDYSTLGKMANSTSDYNAKRVYNSLREAMLDDLAMYSNTANKPGVQEGIKDALNFYKKGDDQFPGGINTFRDRQINKFIKTNSPEDIVGTFFKPKNVSDLTRLKNVTGKEGFQALKQTWLEGLISKGEEQTFNSSKFISAFDKYDKETLDTILTPTEKTGLNKLYEVSKIIKDAEKMAPNPSGTARTVMNTAYMWIRHPAIMAVSAIGSKGIAELYFSNPDFPKLLAKGLSLSADSNGSMAIAQQMMAMAGRLTMVGTKGGVQIPNFDGQGLISEAQASEGDPQNQPQQQPKVPLGQPGEPRTVPLIVLTRERDKAIADEDYDKAEKLEAKIAKIRATSK